MWLLDIYPLVEVLHMRSLSDYLPRGKRKGESSSGGVSELLLVGAFGLGASVFKPDLFGDYNAAIRIGCLLLAFLGIYRSK